MSSEEQRRRLKAFWREWDRINVLRHQLLFSKEAAQRRADYYVAHGLWPSLPVVFSFPEYPQECVGMVCGALGRRKGTPCQSKEIYRNGRCKWHGGLSTGPKTKEGKVKSHGNLQRGPKLWEDDKS